jgi:SAM-dependent methyltransferase
MDNTSSNLRLHPWLGNGEISSTVVPHVAEVIYTFFGGDILDVGCGNGELLRQLQLRGVRGERLFGSDIEAGHVELAKKRTGLQTISWCDFTVTPPFPGQTFDCIAAIGWVHNYWPRHHAVHIPATQQYVGNYMQGIVEQVKANLKPTGRFIYDWCNEDRHPHSDMLYTLKAFGMTTVGKINDKTFIVAHSE